MDEFDIEKLKLEIKTIKQMQNTLTYLISVFDHDLGKVEDLLDQNSNQKK